MRGARRYACLLTRAREQEICYYAAARGAKDAEHICHARAQKRRAREMI